MSVSVLMFTLPRPVSRQPSLMSPSQFNSVDNLHRSEIIKKISIELIFITDLCSYSMFNVGDVPGRSGAKWSSQSRQLPAPPILFPTFQVQRKRLAHRQISNLEEY